MQSLRVIVSMAVFHLGSRNSDCVAHKPKTFPTWPSQEKLPSPSQGLSGVKDRVPVVVAHCPGYNACTVCDERDCPSPVTQPGQGR